MPRLLLMVSTGIGLFWKSPHHERGVMIPFSDLPDNERMRFRYAIEEAGGGVEMYHENDVMCCLPNPWPQFIEKMARIGLVWVRGSNVYWPLGSDRYPDHQRHDGPHTTKAMIGYKGFYMSGRFNVPDWTPE